MVEEAVGDAEPPRTAYAMAAMMSTMTMRARIQRAAVFIRNAVRVDASTIASRA
jgi:hypothetical protein